MSKIWLDDDQLKNEQEFCNCGNLLSLESLEKITLSEGEAADYAFRTHILKGLSCSACNSFTALLC